MDMTQYDIFISYSNQDREVVHLYANRLESIGYKVWFDTKGLHTGALFSEEIVTAIENSNLFIFFSSKYSNSSTWTHGEILTAQKFKKQILPIKLDRSEYNKSLLLMLLPLQYVEAENEYNEEVFAKILLSIEKFIGCPKHSDITSNINTTRKHTTGMMIFATVISLLLSIVMMFVSREYLFNPSLSSFAVFVASISCIALSAYIIYVDPCWKNRNKLLNAGYLTGIIFFLSYMVMALGLCFVSWDIFLLNSTSIPCAALAIYSLITMMAKKRIGYYMLCLSSACFSIGSFWWLDHNIMAPIVIFILSLIILYTLKKILIRSNYWY